MTHVEAVLSVLSGSYFKFFSILIIVILYLWLGHKRHKKFPSTGNLGLLILNSFGLFETFRMFHALSKQNPPCAFETSDQSLLIIGPAIVLYVLGKNTLFFFIKIYKADEGKWDPKTE